MKRRKRKFWIPIAAAVLFVLLLAIIWQPDDRRLDGEVLLGRLENALGDGWIRQSSTQITPVTYNDGQGQTVVHYICQTTYYVDSIPEITGVDPVVNRIIDPETAETSRACKVSGFDAVLCTRDGRSYLCWTLSPECSMVIEYSPESIAEADVFKMAESVPANSLAADS